MISNKDDEAHMTSNKRHSQRFIWRELTRADPCPPVRGHPNKYHRTLRARLGAAPPVSVWPSSLSTPQLSRYSKPVGRLEYARLETPPQSPAFRGLDTRRGCTVPGTQVP